MTYNESKKWANVGQKVKVGSVIFEVTKVIDNFGRLIAERGDNGELYADQYVDICQLRKILKQ